MKIVMPMAGRGSRLAVLSHGLPKPLIPVAGKPMLAWAMESLKNLKTETLIAVVCAEHDRRYGLGDVVRASWQGSSVDVITVERVTSGQLSSVLKARNSIDGDDDLLIASADTLVVSSLVPDLATARSAGLAGLISVANLPGDRWSFVRRDGTGRVIEVAEKRRISNLASTGLYWFAHGNQFLDHADQMIRRGLRVRGEYYVMPVYGGFIHAGLDIGVSIAHEVIDMGEPEVLRRSEQVLTARVGAGFDSGKDVQNDDH